MWQLHEDVLKDGGSLAGLLDPLADATALTEYVHWLAWRSQGLPGGCCLSAGNWQDAFIEQTT
jgi:hypothetical protein